MKNKLLSVILILCSYTAYSQVGIGTPMPNASSQLEIVANDKGLLIPRISLTGSTDTTTIVTGNVNSLLVFNTAIISDIKPGYYYWYDNKWNRVVISNEITISPGTVVYNPTNQQFSYVDNTGTTQVIDITSIIKASETLTTLTNNGAGSYTYKNEIGTDVNIDVVGDVITNASSIFNDPAVTNILEQISNNTEGNVTFDSTTNQFSYVDNTGTTQVVDITSIIKASETLTTLTNNGAGSYTYKNEIGTDVNIDVVGDVITNASSIFNDPAVTNILEQISNNTEGNVTFDSTTNQFSYVDNTGTTQVVDITTIIKASETLTTLTNNGAGSYTYKNEIGTDVNIDVVGDVITNASSIFNDPTVTNILEQISNNTEGNVTFDSTTNQFSYVDNTGTTQVVDITSIIKASETLTTLTNNGAGSYTYKNEIGTDVNIDVVGDVITNASSIFNDPTVTNILEQISNNTEGNVTFDSTTNQFSYVDNTGTTQVVDITSIIKASETLTTLTNNGAGSYTYKNEIGTDVNIDVVGDVITNASSIFNDPAVTNILEQISNNTEGNVTFDSTTNQFSYVDNTGTTQVVDITTIIKASETLTTLTNNGAGSYTYKNEIGTDVNIDVVGDVITNASSIFNDPTVTNILEQISNNTEGNVTFDSTTNQFSYVDNTGTTQVVDITSIIKASETLTTLTNNGAGSYTYKNEIGTDVNIDVVGDVITNASSIFNDPTVTNILEQISNNTEGNVTFDSTTNQFSYVDNTGTTQVVDITSIIKASETLTTLDKNPLNNGQYVYTNEDNITSTIDVIGDVISNASTILNDPTFVTELTNVIQDQETVTTLSQNLTSGAITYNNEAGTAFISQVRSTDAANIITVGTDGGALLTPSAITSATTVSNTSSGNDLSTTVNGVIGTAIPIINTNVLTASGNSLTATINGIASNTIDLTSVINEGETTTNMLQDPITGIITYTNENADSQTAILRSNDADNILTVGTDGGTLLTPNAINSATTVSNTSFANDLSTIVNGITGTAVPIINTNILDTSGNTITSTINGVASNAIDLTSAIAAGTTNDINLAGNTLTSNVNGIISTTGTVSSVSNTSTANIATVTVNGLASTGAPIINTNILETTGNNLTSTINGVVSNPIDLTSAIVAATTNDLSLAGNTLTSNVNGIISTSGTVSGVSNASTANTSTVTVNGITSTGAPIVNTNVLETTGNVLTATINGVVSNPIDLVGLVDNAISRSDITTTTPASVLAVTGTGATLAAATVNIVPSTVEGNVLTTTATGVEWKAPAKLNVFGIKITSTDYTLGDADYTVIARNLTGDITLTLPDAATNTGRVLVFNQNTVSSGGTPVVVNFNVPVIYSDTASYPYIAASVFGGVTGGSLKITLQSDGINWYVINYTM